MTEAPPRLVCLPLSPWSERARWALDHHRIDYDLIVHVPFLGEHRLRRLLGPGRERATVPALILQERTLFESWDIVQYADAHGQAEPLVPPAHLAEVRRYDDLADRTMQVARALVTRNLLADRDALEETLPPDVPAWLRPCLLPITRYGTRWFARKYALRLDDEATQVATLRDTLLELRAGLARNSPYLLGAFSYADILMAGLLQSVSPVADRYIRLGPATRRIWSRPDLAMEFSDLITWRDDLYARHRAKRQRAAAPNGER